MHMRRSQHAEKTARTLKRFCSIGAALVEVSRIYFKRRYINIAVGEQLRSTVEAIKIMRIFHIERTMDTEQGYTRAAAGIYISTFIISCWLNEDGSLGKKKKLLGVSDARSPAHSKHSLTGL